MSIIDLLKDQTKFNVGRFLNTKRKMFVQDTEEKRNKAIFLKNLQMPLANGKRLDRANQANISCAYCLLTVFIII